MNSITLLEKTKLLKRICLLLLVGILFIFPKVNIYAAETQDVVADGELNAELTGTTDERTNITDPGSSDSGDDLKKLNIANTVTVTYDNGNGTINGALRILITLTLIGLAPILIICLTSFTRIIIVLHFTRNALNTQTAPPNQVIIGLALFLTFFIMSPVINKVRLEAIEPLDRGEITQEAAFVNAMEPIREFMYAQTQTKDVQMFMEISKTEWTGNIDDIPNAVLVPSFMVSELRTAFIIGFLIYIPFIVIDMVVASTLMSMGMMMLPPTTISMPFKILLFVLADGWNLVIGNLVRTFY
ncbi:MAG: flagellar type III secretion system pore protein FliP [Lachnospiraceae bacterium]|nr:flagellar type III secretion system pore protein FliP [Candidatus Colinaster scatohippi]